MAYTTCVDVYDFIHIFINICIHGIPDDSPFSEIAINLTSLILILYMELKSFSIKDLYWVVDALSRLKLDAGGTKKKK